MARIVLRNVDETLMHALYASAEANGTTAEELVRRLLETELLGPKRLSLAEVLLAMPDVGDGADFARLPSSGRQ